MRYAASDASRNCSEASLNRALTRCEVLTRPLPHLGTFDRLLLRATLLAARRKIAAVKGIDHIAPARDPFIVALNHTTRLEALLVPPLLMLLRSGRHIHFLADWNFQLIPGIATLYRRAGVITVTRKSAKPRLLNALKPLLHSDVPPLQRARRCLETGRPVGVFAEGTVNRDPHRLLCGRRGAARLSLETGAAVVPVGLRFPLVPKRSHVPEGSVMAIEIGAPLVPPRITTRVNAQDVRAWHAHIMRSLSGLSGKAWHSFEENENERTGIYQDASRRIGV